MPDPCSWNGSLGTRHPPVAVLISATDAPGPYGSRVEPALGAGSAQVLTGSICGPLVAAPAAPPSRRSTALPPTPARHSQTLPARPRPPGRGPPQAAPPPPARRPAPVT